MKENILPAMAGCLAAAPLRAAQRYPVTGLIVKLDAPRRTFVASCSTIPGYMEAMVMPFIVRDPKESHDLAPSMLVDFTLVIEEENSYAENIQIHYYQSLEQEPLAVRQLQLLAGLNKTSPPSRLLDLGQQVPDFALTDQTGRRVTLSQFSGKVVAATFIYTSCPLPNYCFRLSNNFGRLQRRFVDRQGEENHRSQHSTHSNSGKTTQPLTVEALDWQAPPVRFRTSLRTCRPTDQRVRQWRDQRGVVHR